MINVSHLSCTIVPYPSLCSFVMYNFTDINKTVILANGNIKRMMNGGLLIPVRLIWIKMFVNRSRRPVCYSNKKQGWLV